jgi:hypothetical protein
MGWTQLIVRKTEMSRDKCDEHRPVWLKCTWWCLYMFRSINDHLQKANNTLRNSHSGGWSPAGFTRHIGHWPTVLASGDYDDGKFGGIKIGRGNRSTRRKPAPASLCSPQITLDQTRARTRAAAVGSQQLTSGAMAWPHTLRKLLWHKS